VLCFPVSLNRLRLVLHADVDDAKLDRAIQAFGKVADRLASMALTTA
jgi:hypothetical protein